MSIRHVLLHSATALALSAASAFSTQVGAQPDRHARIEQFKNDGRFLNVPPETLVGDLDAASINEAYLDGLLQENPKSALEVMLDLLKDPKRCYLPRNRLIAIGLVAIEPLRQVVGNREYTIMTRLEALMILERIGDVKAWRFAEPAIRSEGSAGLRSTMKYYGSLGPRDRLDEHPTLKFQRLYLKSRFRNLDQEERIEQLSQMIIEPILTQIAADALEEIGEPAVINLVEIARDKRKPELSRIKAMMALGNIEGIRHVPAIIDVLLDPTDSDRIRSSAAGVLWRSGDARAIPALQRATREAKPNPNAGIYDVQLRARQYLWKLTGDPRYSDDDTELRERAARDLRKLNDKPRANNSPTNESNTTSEHSLLGCNATPARLPSFALIAILVFVRVRGGEDRAAENRSRCQTRTHDK